MAIYSLAQRTTVTTIAAASHAFLSPATNEAALMEWGYFNGTVQELALVALADAPSGMGAVWRVRKNGVSYAVYLVETSDPNASAVRLRTSAGTKAARLKT